MATITKPKPAAKTPKVTKPKAAPVAKPKAPKAKAEAAKKPKAVDLAEVGQFMQFTGYRTEMPEDEREFEEGQIIYIVAVSEEEDGVLYDAISTGSIADYLENGETEDTEGGQVSPQECKPLKGRALEQATETFLPVRVIDALAEELAEHGSAIAVADALNEQIQGKYFIMGGALAMILQQGSHLVANGGEYDGEDAFNEFCQAHYGFKASKGRTLARIYTTLSSIPGFDPEKLAGIGWSLIGKAEKYLTEDNYEEVLETVRGESQRTVDVALKTKFAATGTSPSGRSVERTSITKATLTYRADEDSAETIRLAIAECMKQSGFEEGQEGLALERICTEWAQDHVQTKTGKARISAKAKAAAKARSEREKA